MPFEGLARSHSAEFIAAQRARSRSQSSRTGGPVLSPIADTTAEPATYDSSESPALFITPSPIYGVLQRHEWPGYKDRSSSPSSPGGTGGGSFPRRTVSRKSGKSVTARDTIQEADNEDEAAANAAAITQPARRPSDSSSRTLGEAGDDSNDRESQPVGANKEKDLEKGPREGNRNVQIVGDEAEGQDKEKKGQQPQRKSTAQREYDEKYLVTLKGRDHLNPHTWSSSYRWFITGLMGLFVLNATFASSGPSQLLPSIITYFGVSSEVGTLTIALFVAGYCVGPLLWG